MWIVPFAASVEWRVRPQFMGSRFSSRYELNVLFSRCSFLTPPQQHSAWNQTMKIPSKSPEQPTCQTSTTSRLMLDYLEIARTSQLLSATTSKIVAQKQPRRPPIAFTPGATRSSSRKLNAARSSKYISFLKYCH
jgi:hypothetical protein